MEPRIITIKLKSNQMEMRSTSGVLEAPQRPWKAPQWKLDAPQGNWEAAQSIEKNFSES